MHVIAKVDFEIRSPPTDSAPLTITFLKVFSTHFLAVMHDLSFISTTS